jgi:flagellar motility protein MotE (MotC chaperone)
MRALIRTQKRRRQSGKGALLIVAVMLVGSAAIRLGHGAGQALALAPDKIETTGFSPAPSPQACKTSADLEQMLEAFELREGRIESKEAEILDRLQALKVADREIDRKLADLKAAEDRLRELVTLAESASENDLDRLTKVYESMKPKQAAALFEQMDPNFAAGFLGRMRPESAAMIMAGLSPQAAHSFSVVLAGRNANVPRE